MTLHNGSFDIDFNGDRITDLTISVLPITANGSVQGSMDSALQAIGVGLFRGIWSGAAAWPLEAGQQVGPPTGNFIYSDPGLVTRSDISATGESVNALDYTPGWADGLHHFAGVDVSEDGDHYFGWVEMSVQNSGVPTTRDPWYDVTVYGWALNTVANQSVVIPEPSQWAVLALFGSACMIRSRKPLKDFTIPVRES